MMSSRELSYLLFLSSASHFRKDVHFLGQMLRHSGEWGGVTNKGHMSGWSQFPHSQVLPSVRLGRQLG